jgi:hypothetical protein
MVQSKVPSPVDRQELLQGTRALLEQEVERLYREEEYLTRQVQKAQEQLRYYEQLLAEFRQSTGRRAPLHDFVSRLG